MDEIKFEPTATVAVRDLKVDDFVRTILPGGKFRGMRCDASVTGIYAGRRKNQVLLVFARGLGAVGVDRDRLVEVDRRVR